MEIDKIVKLVGSAGDCGSALNELRKLIVRNGWSCLIYEYHGNRRLRLRRGDEAYKCTIKCKHVDIAHECVIDDYMFVVTELTHDQRKVD